MQDLINELLFFRLCHSFSQGHGRYTHSSKLMGSSSLSYPGRGVSPDPPCKAIPASAQYLNLENGRVRASLDELPFIATPHYSSLQPIAASRSRPPLAARSLFICIGRHLWSTRNYCVKLIVFDAYNFAKVATTDGLQQLLDSPRYEQTVASRPPFHL